MATTGGTGCGGKMIKTKILPCDEFANDFNVSVELLLFAHASHAPKSWEAGPPSLYADHPAQKETSMCKKNALEYITKYGPNTYKLSNSFKCTTNYRTNP